MMTPAKTMSVLALCAMTYVSASAPAQADMASDLNDFWSRTGGGANITRPQAYQGQEGGFITGGSLYVRTRPRNATVASLQLPSVSAGCGGIDIFGGSFSFISKEELIKLMEAIMQNAAGFAFELALESLSPTVQETVAKLRDLIQQVNAMNINSCEAGQMLVSSVWPKLDGASQHICQTVGTMEGIFADAVARRHGCQSGQQNSTLAAATGPLKDQVPLNVNYAWRAVQKHGYLSTDQLVAEVFMTMTGTIIVTELPSDGGANYRTISPRAFTPDMIEAFVEGGPLDIMRCDEPIDCLNPSLATVTIPTTSAFFYQARTLVDGLATALSTDTTPPAGAAALVGMTSTPVYETLKTAIAYKHQFVDDEVATISELVAIEFAMIYIAEALSEMQAAAANTDAMGEDITKYHGIVQDTMNAFADFRRDAQERYATALATIEKLRLTQEALAGQAGSKFAGAIVEE